MSCNTVRFGGGGRAGAGSRIRRVDQRRLRPGLLPLEERRLLAAFTVTNTNGSGPGSLPYEVGQANSIEGANQVVFDSSVFSSRQTINLEGGNQINLSNKTGMEQIIGPAAGVTVNAGGNSRVFEINAGVTASFSRLTISGGGGTADRGGGVLILDGANVTLTNCTIDGNMVHTKYGGKEAHLAVGGGVANYGTMTMANCTVSNNTASMQAFNRATGGGVANYGTATLTNCNVSDNTADYGGGISDYGKLTVSNSTVTNDTAHNQGGGLYIGGNLHLGTNHAIATLTSCTISNDTASNGGGGVASLRGVANLTNCTVSNDTTGAYGGGLYNNQAEATLTNCTVSNDAAGSKYYGGGIYNYAATISLTNSTVSNDTAGWYGGGLFNDGTAHLGGTAYVTGCTFSGNSAGKDGGGLYNNRTVYLTNCTFAGNSAGSGYYGGGLYNNSDASLKSCTFTTNSAAYGGGVYAHRSLDMWNTIVAGNTAVHGGSDVYGTVHSGGNHNPGGGYNLIGTAGGSSGWGGNDLIGTAANPINPLLAPLGFYGGPTPTMPLSPGSPAIGKGARLSNDATDQRGFALAGPPDIGAFQTQSGPSAWQVNTNDGGPSTGFGKLSLPAAVNLANLLPGAHTITFAPSVFGTAQTITLTSGQLALTNTIGAQTITGPAAGLTINGNKQNRVFQVGTGVTASLSGLIITGGGGTADQGAGVLNLANANLTLSNCAVSGNAASSWGGGIANFGTVSLSNCTVTGNTATQNGGGLWSYDSSGGGAASLTNCIVSGNTAGQNGGGLFLKGPSMTLSGCTISGNTATQSGGGVWTYAKTVSGATLTGCTISGNTAGDGGGGMNNFTGVATLADCTVSGNTAGRGGGLLNLGNSKSYLTNSTVSGNTGGGLYNAGTLSLTSCTVSANTAGINGGGGLFNTSSRATLIDTIVAANTNSSVPAVASDIAGGSSVSGTFNLIGTGGSGGLPTDPAAGNIVLTDLASLRLAPLGFYGGPTQTMALLPGSAAIGRGTPASGITTDQRGFALDTPFDIGAYQFQSGPLALTVNTTAGGSPTAFGKLSLPGAVNLANVLPGGGTITFDPTLFSTAQTINLSSGQLALTNTTGAETITGPAVGVTVSGGGQSRVLEVAQVSRRPSPS